MMGGGGFGNMIGGFNGIDIASVLVILLIVGAGIIFLIWRTGRPKEDTSRDERYVAHKAQVQEKQALETELAALKKELADKQAKDDSWSDF